MKRVINGKLYNTKTATLLVSWDNRLGSNDFNNCSETLYRTENGNYFLEGDGGAMSRWSKSNGKTTWGSSGLEALTPQEALEWLEDHDENVPEGCPEISALVTEA